MLPSLHFKYAASASEQWLAIVKTERNFVFGGGKMEKELLETGESDLCYIVQNDWKIVIYDNLENRQYFPNKFVVHSSFH